MIEAVLQALELFIGSISQTVAGILWPSQGQLCGASPA